MATTIPDSGQWSDIADTINNNFSAQETATSNLSDTVDDKADSSSLATVATTGDYDDLSNKPVLGTMAAEAAADYTPTSGLGDLATKDAVAVGDIDATGTPDNTKFLRGDMVWAAPPGGGGASWGGITGTLSDQTDLQTALDAKAASASLAAVATSGSYNDLTDKPTLGTMAAETAADYTPTAGLGDLAIKDAVAVGDIDATGTPDNTKFLRGDMVWAAPPGGGGASWGSITGTLSDQTDLQSALDDKADSSSLATVATSGSYNDLTDKPTLGTMAAETAADYTPTASLADVATSGDYNDLINTPTPFSGSYNDLTDKPTLGTAAAADTGGFATAAQGGKADSALQSDDLNISDNNQTGASYTLVLSDNQKLVSMSNASPNTLTVPPNSSVAFPVGAQILIAQEGAGQTTIVEGSGVTVNNASSLILRAQYSVVTLIKRDTNTWLLSGDVE